MKKVGISKYFYNQSIGFLPIFIFMIVDDFYPCMMSFVVSVAVAFLLVVLYKVLSRGPLKQFMLYPTIVSLLIFGLFLFFPFQNVLEDHSLYLIEMIFVLVLTVPILMKRKIRNWVNNSKYIKIPNFRTSLCEFFLIAQFFQNLLTIHLFFILILNLLPQELFSIELERFVYRQLGLYITIFVFVFEHIRIFLISRKLKQEKWIPFLDEKGMRVGTVAKSISDGLSGNYMYPQVRLVMLHKGQIYLMPITDLESINFQKLDYPFSVLLECEKSAFEVAEDFLKSRNITNRIKLRPLLTYKYKEGDRKYQVTLLGVCIDDPNVFSCCFEGGKLWTSKQIERNLDSGIFTEQFVTEYPFLKNTILLAERICCQEE